MDDQDSRVPGLRVACTGRDAVVGVLVGLGDPAEPHEAPVELDLGPDGPVSGISLKVNWSTSLGKIDDHSVLVKSLMANGFVTGGLDSRSYRAAKL